MAIIEEWDTALQEMSRVYHIKDEFGGSPYRMAVEIIRLRGRLGEKICPHYAPHHASAVVSSEDDVPS